IGPVPDRFHRRSLNENVRGKRLATASVLRQRRAMHSFHLIADAAIAGVTVNGWKILGWSGNLVFGARFIIQWIASERARKSIISPAGLPPKSLFSLHSSAPETSGKRAATSGMRAFQITEGGQSH